MELNLTFPVRTLEGIKQEIPEEFKQDEFVENIPANIYDPVSNIKTEKTYEIILNNPDTIEDEVFKVKNETSTLMYNINIDDMISGQTVTEKVWVKSEEVDAKTDEISYEKTNKASGICNEAEEFKHKNKIITSHQSSSLTNKNQNYTINNKSQFKYQCNQCKFKTRREYNIIKHIFRLHTSKNKKMVTVSINSKVGLKVHECDECDYKSDRRYRILEHKSKVHGCTLLNYKLGSKTYQCKRCSYKTNRSAHLRVHSAKIHNDKSDEYKLKSYKCYYCSNKYSKMGLLNYHMEKFHNKVRLSFQCYDCLNKKGEEKIESNEKLEKIKFEFEWRVCGHEIQKLPNGYSCQHCNTIISTIPEMVVHIRSTHKTLKVPIRQRGKKVPTLIQCIYCDMKVYQIKNHVKENHFKDAEIQCKKCGQNFNNRDCYRTHFYRHHKTVEECPFVCNYCGKRFGLRDFLNRHIKTTHEKINRPTYKCEICGYVSKAKQYYTKHMLKHVVPDGGVYCTECQWTGENEFQLKIHKESTHSVDGYQCNQCAYITKSKEHFKLHTIYHKEDKSNHLVHKCTECDYKTHRPYNLKIHLIKHKNPEELKYFYCYHCSYKAKRKDNLKSHIFRHAEFQPVQKCFVCDYSAGSRYELNRHLETHSEVQRNEFKLLQKESEMTVRKRKNETE